MKYGKIQGGTIAKCIARIHAQFGENAVIIRKTPVRLKPWYRMGFARKGWQIDYGIPEGIAEKKYRASSDQPTPSLASGPSSGSSGSSGPSSSAGVAAATGLAADQELASLLDSHPNANISQNVQVDQYPEIGLGKYNEPLDSKFARHLQRISTRLQANECSTEFIQRFLHNLTMSLSQEERPDFAAVLQKSVQKMTALIQTAPVLFQGNSSLYARRSTSSTRQMASHHRPNRRQSRAVLFCGPSGVGKSTSLAKLAAEQALIHKKDISIYSLDHFRVGAAQQLRAYAKIIEVPFYAPVDAASLGNQLEMDGSEFIFIDTFATENSDKIRQETFLELVQTCQERVQLECHLVLAVNLNRRLIEKIYKAYDEALGVHKIILSKLDEAEFIGAFVEIADKLDRPFSYLMLGPQIPSDVQRAHAKDIAEIVLGIQALVENRTGAAIW